MTFNLNNISNINKDILTLKGKVIINGIIKAKTGLHIGGTKETLKIGGTDNPVIRDAFGRILIPGSSLKGKIRNLLEKSRGNYKIKVTFKIKKENEKYEYKTETYLLKDFNPKEIKEKFNEYNAEKCYIEGLPCDCSSCPICILFGPHNSQNIIEPRRVIFRDAYLVEDNNGKYEVINDMEKIDKYLEIKPENLIDRIKGTAQHPRYTERIAAGSKFNFEIVFNIYKKEDKELLKVLIEGMKLLEDDYLGGSGSRGYGKIMFEDLTVIYKSKKYYEEKKEPEEKKAKDLNELLDKINNLNI
ncbi:type III-A CRISPR-associated RAMP protein Csm3 [Methanocaldococcus sp.]